MKDDFGKLLKIHNYFLAKKAIENGFFCEKHGKILTDCTEKDIIFVNTAKLNKDGDLIVYIWEYPGPDYIIYKIEDYGKTWVLTKEKIEMIMKRRKNNGNCNSSK